MKYFNVITFSLLVIEALAFVHVRAKLEAEGIVGGDEASRIDVKYQISLETEMDNICGGGIIADRYVLTAAHCVIDSSNNFKLPALTVLAASLKARTEDNPKAVRIAVEKIYVLNEFNPRPEVFYKTTADLAVLKLERGLGLATNPLLSALQLPESANESYVNETAVVSGYGDNWVHIYEDGTTGTKVEYGGGSYNNSLRYAETRVIANELCNVHFDARVHATHLCAAVMQRDPDFEEGVCSGDSGSPLVLGGATVIGIVSSSPFGCTEAKSPAIYTRVTAYLSFVRDVLSGNVGSDVRVAVLNPMDDVVKRYDEVTRS